ncbi:hypothetical protein PIB30_028183 [Stylosanthes scabra]|uniref:Uncharacterized protein n=1 Tax=Stylosanthes scabra TaxID=79078 RepID=A0ABU6QAJ0_9FABA|nr:hypothetical protein [Stylosanthes scabra]
MTPSYGVGCIAAQSLAGRRLSLSTFGNGTDDGKEGTTTAAGTRPQANDSRCGLGPAMGDSAAAHRDPTPTMHLTHQSAVRWDVVTFVYRHTRLGSQPARPPEGT